MPRTNTSEVIKVLSPGGNYRTGADLTIPIRVASRIVDRVITCASAKGYSIDSGTAKDIESYYAAHIYTRSDPTYKSRSTLSASGSFNADGTEFLQVAYSLDPSGCLYEIVNAKREATGFWLGKPPSEQTDYIDRD